MKKKYCMPHSMEIEVRTMEIIATSNDNGTIKIDNSTEVDASSSFAGKQRGEWGNVWK